MALVAFLRGVNVGGHRRFRPSQLAKELAAYDVVNVGATGLLVARNPGSRAEFRAELMRRLPFETDVAICEGRELMQLRDENPFEGQTPQLELVPFVSVLVGPPGRSLPRMPIGIPSNDEWYVKIVSRHKRFVFGIYRRHMRTIGYLGRIDAALGTRVTTRNWNTILSTIRILERS